MKPRTIFVAFLALALLSAGGVLGFRWWRGGADPTPQPPTFDPTSVNDAELAQAIEKMRQGVLRQPRSAEAWSRLGKVLLANGYHDEAVPCFEQAARLAPNEARWLYFAGLAHRMHNLDAALGCFRQAAQLVPAADPAAFVMRVRYAEALLLAGHVEEAAPLLRELLEQEPDNPRLHLALGALDLETNDLQAARTHLLRCADHPLTRKRAANHLATVSLRQGDSAAAERYRKRARRLPRDPEAPDPFVDEYAALMIGRQALFFRGEYLLTGGEIQQAIEVFQTLIAVHPDAVEAYIKLGMAWLERNNYAQAEQVLRRATAVQPESVQAHYFLCVALFNQAEQSGAASGFDAAAAEARKTLARKPDHAFAHLYLGLVLRKQGQSAKALEELRQAVRFSPESTDPHLHFGEALLESGERQEGLAQLEKAVEVAGEDDSRPREALKKWRKAVEGKQ